VFQGPAASGTLRAALAALAFGATAPFVKHFGVAVGPFTTAALLYAGAAFASFGRSVSETPVRAKHLPRLGAVALVGAMVAPVCLAWGLQRTTAVTASLLLNFEAVFTVLLARAAYREPVGARVAMALALMLAGGTLLVLGGPRGELRPDLGMLAVTAATLAWATDNTLTRPLADLDPRAVVMWKGAFGSALSLALGLSLREEMPPLLPMVALVICGATGYGLSLRLYLGAQRVFGAGRAGSVFALAPFVGAGVAILFGESPPPGPTLAAGLLLGAGVALHATEKHAHPHRHFALEHEHAHRHDDGHHDHLHDPPVEGEHSHHHRHEPTEHEHAHGQDVHHRHDH